MKVSMDLDDTELCCHHLRFLLSENSATLRSYFLGVDVEVERFSLGTMASENLFVGDPLCDAMTSIPTDKELPPEAEVFSLVATVDEQPTIAALGLVFDTSRAPVTWRYACDPLVIGSAVCGFANRGYGEHPDRQQSIDELLQVYEEQEESVSGIVITSDDFDLALSQAGEGTNTALCFWGLDEDQQPVCVAVDYLVLGDMKYRDALVQLPLPEKKSEIAGLSGIVVEKAGLLGGRIRIRCEELKPQEQVMVSVVLANGEEAMVPVREEKLGIFSLDPKAIPGIRSLHIRHVLGRKNMEVVSD